MSKGALQLWQKHCSTESRTRPISMFLSYRRTVCGLRWNQVESVFETKRKIKPGRVTRFATRDRKERRERRRVDGEDTSDEQRRGPEVAELVSGAVAGGRLIRTVRHDARRRSISTHRHLCAPNHGKPPPATATSLPDDKPPFHLCC